MSRPLLQGVAFISGAASGIGKATAYAFARHGVRQLVLADINGAAQRKVADELKALPEIGAKLEILSLAMDTGKEAEVVKGHEEMIRQFGRIDYAVNNAGMGAQKPTVDVTGEEFMRMIQVNLMGVWVAQREQIRQMLKQEPLPSEGGRRDRGVIVNTSSMLGLVSPSVATPTTPYSAAKHGVVGITRADSITYGPHGIRINAICPGYIESPIMSSAGGVAEVMKSELKKVPLGRFGQVEEIAESVSYLASPMSSYMHGATLVVDGGYTAQ